MSNFESSGVTDADNLDLANEFFGNFEKFEIPEPTPKPSENPSTLCATWVRDQSFEIQPTNHPGEEPVEFADSPLPESVTSWHGFQENRRRKPEKLLEIEKSEKRRKSESSPPPFFEKLAETQKTIKENPENWRKIDGIYVEKSQFSENTIPDSFQSSGGPKTKFHEILALFDSQNTEIYQTFEFENSFKFDWELYEKDAFQYVVFTKICQSHPENEFVEMRKEDTRCSDCGSSNLAFSIRLTVPLDLSDVPIPIFDDIQIHVSFLATHLLEKSETSGTMEFLDQSVEFSKKKCREMWNLEQKMQKERKTVWEYKQWFDGLKEFVKKSLHSKRLHLHHGRVIRRKIEQFPVEAKKRCLIFAQLFDLEDS
ncbi:hypothetical protein L5515_005511 [Caenorhabditis briggsae]|uniref:Uncharacterized protein n=1 Tax=Caenorhabditis briggsae TaxID=6238 RepID=A0AAE9ERY8_CAEBR|nr:hypothetical protein L5515_005511 [Caenorhabditis briggsae]